MDERAENALSLLESVREGFLATLEDQRPYVSAVSYIYEKPAPGQQFGKISMLLSEMARHTRNLQKNPNVSLVAVETGPAPVYEKKRATVQGTIHYVKDDARFKVLKEAYLRVFPTSEQFFSFGDFRFFEIQIAEIHYIAGFGNIKTFR